VSNEINVLVVDDSALMRNLVSRIIESAPDMTVCGTAMNGEFALQKIERLNPDAVVLDLEMPTMNGLEFLRERRSRRIEVPVIILSSVAKKGAQVTMEALNLGASDFIPKPSGAVSHDIHVVGEQLTALVRAFGTDFRRKRGLPLPDRRPEQPETRGSTAEQTPVTPEPDRSARRPAPDEPLRPAAPPEVVALGISTGGPNALRTVMAQIDPQIPVPILVVQHMPPGFTSEFAASLDRICPLEVREAADGDVLKPGRVLIAPGDHHMEVERRTLAAVVRLHQNAPHNGHRPSAGLLFTSVAREFGNRAIAVIMTGMGRDGAFEIGEVRRAGGITLGQDEATSVVYGMPRVAWENGNIQRQIPLHAIASTLNSLVRNGS
jgi:two-component system, chemotaxis family, protein-glutamate methylesterase/glutaminase